MKPLQEFASNQQAGSGGRDPRFMFVRVSECLGGVRISNLHRRARCHYLHRRDAVGTVTCIDLAVLPAELTESMKFCPKCNRATEAA